MSLETLVDATELELWANRRDAQAVLPKLIRRLVHSTVERIVRVGFRADEGVQLGGWDGIVTAEQGNAYGLRGSSLLLTLSEVYPDITLWPDPCEYSFREPGIM